MKSSAIDIKKLKGRGKSLYIAVSQSKYSNREAAERTSYKENTFYSHIKREFLDYKILAKYGKAIAHDFSNEYPEIVDFIPNTNADSAEKMSKVYLELQEKYMSLLEKGQVMRDRYDEKYAELQSQYNELLEKYNEIKNK